MDNLTEAALTHDLKSTAKSLGIPEGAADSFIKNTIKNVKKTFATRSMITEADLNRTLVKELKKYHADFAYIYEIRDIII